MIFSFLNLRLFNFCTLILSKLTSMEEEKGEKVVINDDDLDDLDDIPDLFHKSSLKERTDPELPISTDESYSVKKIYDN